MSTARAPASIGVAIPTYKREGQLTTLVESIPDQYRIYVSDNGSTLSQAFADLHSNVTVKGTGPTVQPIFTNWNLASKMPREDYVAIPSDDDIYKPGAFGRIEAMIAAHPEAEIFIFGHDLVDEDYARIGGWCPAQTRAYGPGDAFTHFEAGVPSRMPSIVFRRALLERIGYFDERFELTAADSFLVQRAVLEGHTVLVAEVISGYRVWGGGLTGKTIGTPLWLQDVTHWGRELMPLLLRDRRHAPRARRIVDEIYAQNFLGGLANLARIGDVSSLKTYLGSARYPAAAKLGTHARIWVRALRTLGLYLQRKAPRATA